MTKDVGDAAGMYASQNHRIEQLVIAARDGDRDAIGQLLESYRDYLRRRAAERLAHGLHQRLDASDLVQQTFLEAHQSFAKFAGSTAPEFVAWLKQILHCNVANAMRDHFLAQKRAAGREQSLASSTGDGMARVAAATSTPSHRLMRIEESLRFLDALDELPFEQSAAVRLRYLEGLSVSEIAAELNRSRSAAAGLIKRGVQQLRRLIES